MPAGPNATPVAYTRLVTLLLLAAYTFSSMDRSIIAIIGQAMKTDLGLSDTQLGLLGGTAFAVLYAFGGIPIARLAERVSRVNIITIALIVWSGLTALCAAAATFPQLLLIRAGVGVAESGCSPPAHSLISDYFPKQQRASALSVYTCGISLGYLLAAVVGGYVTQHEGWRSACVLVGLPGLAIAVLIRILVREPPRGLSERETGPGLRAGAAIPPAAAPAPPPFSMRTEVLELAAVGRALLGDPPILHMVLGMIIGAFAAYGFYAFIPPYYRRAFGLDYASIGIAAGLAGGVAVGLGIAAGGFLSDALARHSARWYALVPAVGGLIALPLYGLALCEPGWKAATWLLAVAGFFQYVSLGPTFGVVQNVVDRRRRATATAFLYIGLNVLALGGGPLFTGWVSDHFAAADFQRQQRAAPSGGSTTFGSACPGGVARATAGAGRRAACAASLARGSRSGLATMLIFFAWASLHYLLAAGGLEKSLLRAARASSVHSGSV